MPCGFDMVAMCAMFILFNSGAREHAFRKVDIGCQLFCKGDFLPKSNQSIGDNKNRDTHLFIAAKLNQTRDLDTGVPTNKADWVLTVENLDEH